MIQIAKACSFLMLLLVIVPCLFYFTGAIRLETVKLTALIGTIGWFLATPLWMGRTSAAHS